MKVLHIQAGDISGGAARGVYWLHIGLKDLNVESKILTNSRITLGDEDVISIANSKKEKIKLLIRRQLDSIPTVFYRNRKRIIFSTGLVGYGFTKTEIYKWADVIHLHWINDGFVNIKHLAKVDKPIVWTMRDMWPMTGGCHYSMKCIKYKTGCGNCEQLNSNKSYDLSKIILNRKKKYLPKTMKLVGISDWLSGCAKESQLFKDFDVQTIHNNVNTDVFFPIEKNIARMIWGITSDKKIVLVGSQCLKVFYKGFDKFIEAIKRLDKNKYYFCFFGNLEKKVADKLDYEYKNFGFLHDTISLRLLYSASDVFVAPSLMDAFCKTLAESMACGTPVVCFDATGPKDIVSHKIDGYKAEPFDSSDLANGIIWILEDRDRWEKLSEQARKKVKEMFDVHIIAEKYAKLYEKVMANNG